MRWPCSEGGVTPDTRYYPYCNVCGDLDDEYGWAREEDAQEVFLEHMNEVHDLKYSEDEGKFVPV